MWLSQLTNIVSLENTLFEYAIEAFPNPAQSWIKINTSIEGGLSLRLYNSNGELINHLSMSEGREIELDLSSHPSGLYFIEVRSGSINEVKKVIKL